MVRPEGSNLEEGGVLGVARGGAVGAARALFFPC